MGLMSLSCGPSNGILRRVCLITRPGKRLHSYGKPPFLIGKSTISMAIFNSYTHTPKSLQCLRWTAIPNQNARHDPCPGTDLAKPLSPLETLALTSLDQTIMVLFAFDRIPLERRFPTGIFSWILLTPTNKNAKQALFLVCILQDDKGKKTRSKTRSKTRYGKSPASTHMDFGPQAANLPFLGSLVEMIIPALCRSTRKQQQQQLSNQQPQPNTT